MIKVNPSKYEQLGESNGVNFHFITNSAYSKEFNLIEGDYESATIHKCDKEGEFSDIISGLSRPAHILVISPDILFSSPDDEVLGNDAKLLVIPCNSSSINMPDIEVALAIMEKTDVATQEKWANRFFEIGEKSKQICFYNPVTKTKAIFDHLSDDYEWFEQLGILDWGSQQFCPAGEVSVLPLGHGGYSSTKRLILNGEITFHGIPLVNSGKPSFLKNDREYIYKQLEPLKTNPVVASVENGVISSLKCINDGECNSILEMLEALFKVDSRYRNIWEIGFGSNTNMQTINGNKVINEVYGHKNGCVHWGLGLTPWTQYHIDIICPQTIITNEKGDVLAGGEKPFNTNNIKRNKTQGCPCVD